MSDKSRSYTKFDIVKELIWGLIVTVATFVYWVLLLLGITFVFNSILKLSFQAVLLIAVFLTLSMLLYRIIKAIIKYAGK